MHGNNYAQKYINQVLKQNYPQQMIPYYDWLQNTMNNPSRYHDQNENGSHDN